jgi:hypothetical protein
LLNYVAAGFSLRRHEPVLPDIYYSERKSSSIHPHPSPPPSRGREFKEGITFLLRVIIELHGKIAAKAILQEPQRVYDFPGFQICGKYLMDKLKIPMS